MNLIDPPGGKPWALLGLCAGSLVLNLVLVAKIALSPASAVAEVERPAPEADEAAAAIVAEEPATAVVAPPIVEDDAPPAPSVEVPADLRVMHVAVKDSLSRTFQLADPDHGDVISAVFARLFFFDLNLRSDLLAGDDVRLAYSWDGALARIPAATYTSRKLGKTLAAYEYEATGDSFPSWWDASGQEMALRLTDAPLDDYEQITSLLKDRPKHHGMDFKVPEGSPALAAKAATVVQVNWNVANNGDCVELAYADGVHAKYLHLSQVDVKVGQRVGKGDVVGLTGNTGHSTAPHLHYELDRNGTILDPVDYHGTYRRTLGAEDQAGFEAERERLDAILGTAP
jgi:murein DD-endopeptidase